MRRMQIIYSQKSHFDSNREVFGDISFHLYMRNAQLQTNIIVDFAQNILRVMGGNDLFPRSNRRIRERDR